MQAAIQFNSTTADLPTAPPLPLQASWLATNDPTQFATTSQSLTDSADQPKSLSLKLAKQPVRIFSFTFPDAPTAEIDHG